MSWSSRADAAVVDVSRETPPGPPEPPEAARGVFPSDRLPLARAYAEALADAGVVRGLIGPREVSRLWDRHLMNCAVLAPVLPQSAAVADIGSGAGLPGIVLAIARADLSLTLIEPLLRRTTFLSEIVGALGLDNVEVRRGRAEEVAGDRRFDVVTSRAVAPLDRLLRWSMPLVAAHGALIALKGASAAEEVEEHRAVWQKLGCARPEVLTLGAEVLTVPTHAVRVSWADPDRVGLAGPTPSRPTGAKRRRR